jgi:DNA-binding NarL/FixJ family response regulator
LRVLLADDHALVRDGFASLVRAWGAEVVGQAANGAEALALARRLRPDVILMDIAMPETDGLEATRRVKAELPDVRIVVVTVSDDDEDLFEAIKSGAEGYLLKDMASGELQRVLRAVEAGEPALSKELAAKILGEFARLARDGPVKDESELTAREREVLQLVAGGATNREVAERLYLSEHTVKFHMRNILGKLHTRNRAEAAAYAIRSGLVDSPSGARALT